MAVFKKSSPSTEPFRVPSHAEVDAEFGEIKQKIAELQASQSATAREIVALEEDIRARPAPVVNAGVAALLGEVVDTSLASRPARLRDLRKHAADLDEAIEILRRSLSDRRGQASAKVREAVKGEYGRRVAAVADALRQVNAAHLSLAALIDEFDREDIAWAALGPMQPNFLGNPHDGHVQIYLKEARALGYVD